MSAVLKHIAVIAKGLSKAELHVLIELASRAEEAGENDAVASSREVAERTGLARSSVQIAVDSLNSKGVILSNAGTATRPAVHRLLFLDAVEIRLGGPIFRPEVGRESSQGGLKSGPVVAQIPGQGGPTVRPVAARKPSQSGLNTGPVVAQFSGQGGLDSGPRPTEKSSSCEPSHIESASASAESIEKNDFKNLIDRIQTAKKSDFYDEVFEAARDLIASHHAKFAREGCQLPGKPDDQIVAQFLAVAEWPRLSRLLHDLLTERQSTSFSWGWYVTVALQRIYGISPDEVRLLRERLRKTTKSAAADSEQKHTPTPYTVQSLAPPASPIRDRCRASNGLATINEQIRMLAARKSL